MADTVDSRLDYLQMKGSTKLNFRWQFCVCLHRSVVQNSLFVSDIIRNQTLMIDRVQITHGKALSP